jgi:hypothetical protein
LSLEPVSTESGLNRQPNLIHCLFSFLAPVATDFPRWTRLKGKGVLTIKREEKEGMR